MAPVVPLLLLLCATPAQERIREDVEAGRPLVTHIHVALADDVNQGIAKVVGNLGDGMNPNVNLYWGALYGVKSYLPRAGWKLLRVEKAPKEGVLERRIFVRRIRRGRVYVVADAWAGPKIEDAIRKFSEHASGHGVETISLKKTTIEAGGAAHVVAYVGHNGLMEFEAPAVKPPPEDKKPNAAIVLACISKDYFLSMLEEAGAEPLLMTRSLMAPEAYTVDAALVSWFSGGTVRVTHRRASDAYAKYQKCKKSTARWILWGPGVGGR